MTESTATSQDSEKPASVEGFTKEDFDLLLFMIDQKSRILVGSNDLGIPMIHDVVGSNHCGYGVFKATTPEYEVTFDGGNAMSRLPSGYKGYTILSVNKGEYPYDFEAVRKTLENLKASL